MRLKLTLSSIRDLRKNSRIILEKMKDLSFPSKFLSVIEKNKISVNGEKSADIIICINSILESYNCFLSIQFDKSRHPLKKYRSLVKSLIILKIKIEGSLKSKSPIKRKFIANALRAHTKYFNSLELNILNTNCHKSYEKVVLSSISVWNNQWL